MPETKETASMNISWEYCILITKKKKKQQQKIIKKVLGWLQDKKMNGWMYA